ncbi:LOW QUALITY PROTEIN: hypothetical protein HID58_006839, partial [Brassica napus]
FSLLRRRHVRNVNDVGELDNITYSTITTCAIFTTKRLNGSRGCIKKMRDIVLNPNVVVYCIIICWNLEAMGRAGKRGLGLFPEMVGSGLTPNEKTFDRSIEDFILYNTLLNICVVIGAEEEMLEVGVQVNVIRCTCLVQCLGKTKRRDDLVYVSIQRRIKPDDRLQPCYVRVMKMLKSSADEFAADVRLTFDNALRYNPPENFVHDVAKELLEIFEARWESLRKKKVSDLHGEKVTEGSRRQPVEVGWVRQSSPETSASSGRFSAELPKRAKEMSQKVPPLLKSVTKLSKKDTPVVTQTTLATKLRIKKFEQGLGSTVENPSKGSTPTSSCRCSSCGRITCICLKSCNSSGSEVSTLTDNLVKDNSCSQASESDPHSNGSISSKNDCVSSQLDTPLDNGKLSFLSYELKKPLPPMPPLPPEKAIRAAILKCQFAETILKAKHRKVLDKSNKSDLIRIQIEKEQMEKTQREEKARIEAEIAAAKLATRMRAEAELKEKRERERLKLEKMVKEVDLEENNASKFNENMINLCGSCDPTRTWLPELGLFLRNDDDDSDEDDSEVFDAMRIDDLEEGEILWKRRQWLPMNSLASTANSLLFFRCYWFSKRLSYVPELSEIVKQFKTKHGKDFPTSAIELRPDSGVSRLTPKKSSKEKTMAPPTTLAVPTTFDDLEGDFCNKEVFVRLIRCWEARNFKKANILMGVELLLIDSKGFISTHFLPRFKEDLKPNTIYKLNGFSIRLSKSVYRVSPHKHGISFNNKTTFTPVHEVDYQIDSQHFRIRDLQAFTDITMAPPTTLAVPTTFDDLEGDFCNKEVFVRLIHCWEARHFKKANILMGVELLLIDSKSTTIQGFISTHFLPRFKEDLKPNTIYKLNGFSIRLSKSVYRVSPHKHGISFNNKTTFTPVHEVDYQIDSQHFRIRDLQAFTDIVDKHTDLLDIIGFLRVINGDNLDTQTPMATAPAPAGERSKDMVFLHVQLEDGETARVYLWDKIAAVFRSRWNDSKTKPSVILLTTLNSKTLGADGKIPPTVNSSSAAVTKVETVTLKEIHKFLENESPQVANFICTATITDVMEEYGWYFISCTACKSQLERSETTFICPNFKCKKPNTVGLIRLPLATVQSPFEMPAYTGLTSNGTSQHEHSFTRGIRTTYNEATKSTQRMMITLSIERHSNICPSVFDGMAKLLDKNLLLSGGESEATASTHTSVEGRETSEEATVKEDG